MYSLYKIDSTKSLSIDTEADAAYLYLTPPNTQDTLRTVEVEEFSINLDYSVKTGKLVGVEILGDKQLPYNLPIEGESNKADYYDDLEYVNQLLQENF